MNESSFESKYQENVFLENDAIFPLQMNLNFNLHKSLTPFGVDDFDAIRLAGVYGADIQMVQDELQDIRKHNERKAYKLCQEIDITPLKNIGETSIAFLGDSITSYRQSYFHIIRAALDDCRNIRFFDHSVTGYKSVDMMELVWPTLMSEAPAIAHIMIGTNDLWCVDGYWDTPWIGIAEYEKSLHCVASALAAIGTKMIFSTIPVLCHEKLAAYNDVSGYRYRSRESDRQAYNDVVRNVAQEFDAAVNEMDSEYSQYSPADLTFSDGTHLNGLGQTVLAKKVLQYLIAATQSAK